MPKQEITFSNEELKDIAGIISDGSTFDMTDDGEISELKKLHKKISQSNVNLAILFVRCYNFLDEKILEFKDDTHDYVNKISKYLDSFSIEVIREFVNQYHQREEIGDYILEEKLNTVVARNREHYLKLIRFFFKIIESE